MPKIKPLTRRTAIAESMVSFVNSINARREIKGLHDEDICARANIKLSTFYRRKKNPGEFSLEELINLCGVYGTGYVIDGNGIREVR